MNKIKNFAELAAIINNLDDGLKKLLFGISEITVDDLNSVDEAINPIVQVAYLLVYLKWAANRQDESKYILSQHAEKAFDMLGKMYERETYCLDAVIYILSEARRDVIANGEKSFFYGLLTNSECAYSRIYDLIHDFWSHELDFVEANERVILTELLNMFENVNMFEGVKFNSEGAKNVFTVGGETYDASEYLIRDTYGRFYMLCNYELISDVSVLCRYVGFDNPDRKYEQIKTFKNSGEYFL